MKNALIAPQESIKKHKRLVLLIFIISCIGCPLFTAGDSPASSNQPAAAVSSQSQIPANLIEALSIAREVENPYAKVQSLILVAEYVGAVVPAKGIEIIREAEKASYGITTSVDMALTISKNFLITAIAYSSASYSSQLYGAKSLQHKQNSYLIEQGRIGLIEDSVAPLERERNIEDRAVAEVATAMAPLDWRAALQISEKIKSNVLKCRVLSVIGGYASLTGEKKETIQIYANAAAIINGLTDPDAQLLLLTYLAYWKGFGGDTKGSQSLFNGCVAKAKAITGPRQRMKMLTAIALAQIPIDRNSGLSLLRELLTYPKGIKDCDICVITASVVDSLINMGEIETAIEMLGKCPGKISYLHVANPEIFSRFISGKSAQESLETFLSRKAAWVNCAFEGDEAIEQIRKELEKNYGKEEAERLIEYVKKNRVGEMVGGPTVMVMDERAEEQNRQELIKRFGASLVPILENRSANIQTPTDYSVDSIDKMKALTLIATILAPLNTPSAKNSLNTVKSYIELMRKNGSADIDWDGYSKKFKKIMKPSASRKQPQDINSAIMSLQLSIQKDINNYNEFLVLQYEFVKGMTLVDTGVALQFVENMEETYTVSRTMKFRSFMVLARKMDKGNSSIMLQKAYGLLRKEKISALGYGSFDVASMSRQSMEMSAGFSVPLSYFQLYAAMVGVDRAAAANVLADAKAVILKLNISDKNVPLIPESVNAPHTIFGLVKQVKNQYSAAVWGTIQNGITQEILWLARTDPEAAKTAIVGIGPRYWQVVMLCSIP